MALATCTNLKCEYLENPLGIDIPDPRFYWQLETDTHNTSQTAYRILVASSKGTLDEDVGDMWDSGRVDSADTIHVVYRGATLESAATYCWKVKSVLNDGMETDWSEPAQFTTGLFEEADWEDAVWISKRPQEEWETAWKERKEIEQKCIAGMYLPSYFGARMSIWERQQFHYNNPYDSAPLYRKDFTVTKEIVSARAFVCGIGYHELHVNGQRIGDAVLEPGWTDYRKTILYVSSDITEEVQQGDNTIGVMLGRGNYGMLTIDHWQFWKEENYIGQPKLKCLFIMEYADGTRETVASGTDWKITDGPVIYDDPYMGEIVDGSKETPGWDKPGLDLSSWDHPVLAPSPGGKLSAQLCEPIRVTDCFKPVKIERKGSAWFIDAGRNTAGWMRLRSKAPSGAKITVYYGENDEPLAPCGHRVTQQAGYVASGKENEILEPRFCYYGFRYIQIEGYPGELTAEDITICRVNSSVTTAGVFSCSENVVNEIHEICTNSLITNLHSIPTDCPHREKNGWFGDAVTGIEFGMANYDLAAFITKFTRDIFDTQTADGAMMAHAPSPEKRGLSTLWASAAIHLPWYMYMYYGDLRLFERYWDQMKLFVENAFSSFVLKEKPGIMREVFGDWVNPYDDKKDSEITAVMNMYLALKRLCFMAGKLDKEEDASWYQEKADFLREAAYKYCFNDNGFFQGIENDEYRQAPNAMALQYDICREQDRKPVYRDLLKDITEKRGNSFYAGIFGCHALWELLADQGDGETAYKVLMNSKFPGYRYMLNNGATSVWESWVNDFSQGSSENHYFMGSVDNFFYRYLAGIQSDPLEPGYKSIVFKPVFIDALDEVKASYDSIHGRIAASWKRGADKGVTYRITIPPNCRGQILLPGGKETKGSGDYEFTIRA